MGLTLYGGLRSRASMPRWYMAEKGIAYDWQLLDMGAKDVAVLRDGAEVRVPVSQLAVGDRFLVRPGETVAGVPARVLRRTATPSAQ